MSMHERANCGFGLFAQLNQPASHHLLEEALHGLSRLTHRGVVGEDGLAGDGCGILLPIDKAFFSQQAVLADVALDGDFAIGLFFLDPALASEQQISIEKSIAKQGLHLAGWRSVPVNPAVLSQDLQARMPQVMQAFIDRLQAGQDFDRRLYLAQKLIELAWADNPFFAVCSLSKQTIVYKGLVLPENLPVFYPDLSHPDLRAQLALVHQRFSTNTLSTFKLCQPFSILAHNGEINTIQGNRYVTRQQTRALIADYLPELEAYDNLVNQQGSDSMSLDQWVACLRHCGLPAAKALRLLLPPVIADLPASQVDKQAWFDYFQPAMPSWEGPAGIVFFDGRYAGCILDRNGFRPARLQVFSDGLTVIGSEVGLVNEDHGRIVKQSRLKPGQLLLLDTAEPHAGLVETPSCWFQDRNYRALSPRIQLAPEPLAAISEAHSASLIKAFDLSYEEVEQSLLVMAKTGKEATVSMGDDTPLAALSSQPRQLFDFLRQQFAQVTNPPIDSLRERWVMSAEIVLGDRHLPDFLKGQNKPRIILPSPLVGEAEWQGLSQIDPDQFHLKPLSLGYQLETSYPRVLDHLLAETLAALDHRHLLLCLDDGPQSHPGPTIHPLLAVGALHQGLTNAGHRARVSIIISSGWVRDPHHLAMLVAAGAQAIHPWLAYQTIRAKLATEPQAISRFQQAMQAGLLKICAKMGVCTINSYQGSQLFDVIGLADEIVQRCFPQAPQAMPCLDWTALQVHQERFYLKAGDISQPPRHGGLLKYVEGQEYHDYNPQVVQWLIAAVNQGDAQAYARFAATVNERPPSMLRDFFQIRPAVQPLPLAAVESIASITRRFETAAMSLGALAPEAHESLAEAMNELQGRSNSGEGGEARARHQTAKSSKIKQVASGRFGVTPEYLVNAEVIQIKIAQGAKPGEGGQLPGEKVNALIAELRYCLEGVTLISPPPHHDIYSIEDLAQLIFDLKQINPRAYISVKLVASPGIGTIAAGVVKAYADCITISGYDGGTGASPISSIRYAGLPWELGLLETQSVLLANNLRHRVCLQVDGGFKTGLDVIKAALLGAETFGFGTAPMVALGCKYLRICHLNNCATGIATQDETLRRQFYQGNKDKVIRYFNWVAEEVRHYLAQLGYPSLQAIIGRHDLLEALPQSPIALPPLHASQLDVTSRGLLYQQGFNPPFDQGLLSRQLTEQSLQAYAATGQARIQARVQNNCRSLGVHLVGELMRHDPRAILPPASIDWQLTGVAGQSLGAFMVEGMSLTLTGMANDYVGKGMHGGRLIILPDASLAEAEQACLAGNTCLYGATGGRCLIAGRVGERFAVRNSGAEAVVIGVGYHGCEYMTAGLVIILSTPEANFAAGMTGGIAFVYDDQQQLAHKTNPETVAIMTLDQVVKTDLIAQWQVLMGDFIASTQSQLAQSALRDQSHWRVVVPRDQACVVAGEEVR